MKIIFFGTPEFAVPALESLYKTEKVEVLSVVTQPDKPVGRKKTMTAPPVKDKALELGLPVFQPQNKEELFEKLQNISADFFVVVAFGMILPKKVLDLPKYGSINIHASLLPKYRGASPIQESLLHGDKETGVSIMQMDDKLDHGSIYLLKKVTIEESDTLETLTQKLAQTGAAITPLVLHDIKNQGFEPISQYHDQATYCKKIEKEDGKIDWNKSAEEIKNMIRAYTPWPSVYTEFQGKKLKIVSAKVEKANSKKEPGTFFQENKTLKIATTKGNLLPQKLQLEGKNEVSAQDFLNGFKILS